MPRVLAALDGRGERDDGTVAARGNWHARIPSGFELFTQGGNEVSGEIESNDVLRAAAEAIWVAAQRETWASLLLVPAEPGLSTAALAEAVAEVGSAQRGERVEALDLRGLSLAGSRSAAEKLADESAPYQRVAAIDCPTDSQTALLLASAAGVSILVVELERTESAAARRVMDLVGPARFLGAVVASPRPT